MSDIYVFSSNEESNDYSTMGLVGALTPSKCDFKETANGESIITMTHPLDDFGKYTALQRGNILVVPVPVRTTPEIQNEACVTTVWTYKVKPLAQLTSKNQRTLYKKKTGNGKKKVMKAGDVVTVVQMSDDENARWKVKSKYGTGWVMPSGFDLITKHIIGDNSNAIEEVQSPWTITDQYFRIYEATVSLDEVNVSARHISYDLLYNMTSYKSEASVKLQTALNGVLKNCYSQHDFEAFTNVANVRPGLCYEGKNPIDAILNLEDGICTKFDVSLVRDNYELFFLKDPGMNRGVRIQYSKNMLGVEFTSSEDEVVTRIVPVGETKSGDPLYLDSSLTKRYIDSQYINAYPIPHVYELKCENCKVGEKDDQGGTVTVAIARARMREQANKMLENGCDEPKITMKVEFLNLGDTEEYAQFKNLENLFLFDYVIVQHPTLYYRDTAGVVRNIDVTARVVSIEWDCILERMNSVEIGQVGMTLANTGISTWQIPNGFSGSKIGYGTIGSGALASDVISSRHIQSETINASHLNATEVTAFILEAITATINSITAGDISTNTLSAAFAHLMQVVADNIQAGTVTADALDAVMASIVSISVGAATFDLAEIQNLLASALVLDEGQAGSMHITNLAVTSANLLNATVGKLVIKGDDGGYYEVGVGSDGVIHTAQYDATAQEIADGRTTDGRQIVTETINAEAITGATVKAQEAVLNRVLTAALTAGQITANDAMLASASIPLLYATSIRALGNSLDISANQSIQLLVGNVNAIGENIRRMIRIEQDGLHVGDSQTTNEVLIDSESVNVVLGGFKYSKFAADYVQFGDYQLRRSVDGGLVFKKA